MRPKLSLQFGRGLWSMKVKQFMNVVWRLVLVLGLLGMPSAGLAQEGGIKNTTIDFGEHIDDTLLKEAIQETLQKKPEQILTGSHFAITSNDSYGDWARYSIASLDGPMCDTKYVGGGDNCGDMLLAYKSAGVWIAALRGTDEFNHLLSQVPNEYISSKAKSFLFTNRLQSASIDSTDFRFPWASGETWEITDGWHEYNSIDVAPYKDKDTRVLSSADGAITFVCQHGKITYNVKIQHAGATFDYYHLDKGEASYYDSLSNTEVVQGRILGKLRKGSFSLEEDGCGRAVQNYAHLHWKMPRSSPVSIEGWTPSANGYSWIKGTETSNAVMSTNLPVEPNSQPSEPTEPKEFCPAPKLKQPSNNATIDNSELRFEWEHVDCEHDEYKLRIRTEPVTSGSGDTIENIDVDDTDKTVNFDSKWLNQDLYWSVRADGVDGDADWATMQRFRIEEKNKSPSITFQTANGNNGNDIVSNQTDWTFTGVASDPENKLDKIVMVCEPSANCGSGQSEVTSGNWTFSRTGMKGKVTVYFRAYDDQGQTKESRRVTLNIDSKSPTTARSLNATRRAQSGWYSSPVTVKLSTTDHGTGGAVAGIKEIHYQINNVAQPIVNGRTKQFTINANGINTIKYYAVDKAGNRENEKTVIVKIDAIPPSPPASVTSTNGAPNDTWQKEHNFLNVTWSASTDAHSGGITYDLEWKNSTGRQLIRTNPANNARNFMSEPVGTGEYILRGRARDQAGNFSDWVTMYTLKYDNTPPANPVEATHAVAGVRNDIWQRASNQADFTWPVPEDKGSGIREYQVYWGTDKDGESATTQTGASFESTDPLCSDACTGYLRVRAVDNVGNPANRWTTVFVSRYDNVPPTLDFTFPGNVTETTTTSVQLQLNGNDGSGSGVSAMRFSSDEDFAEDNDGWENYSLDKIWQIPAIGRQAWPIYAQVRDAVGLVSPPFSREIYFEVNREQSASSNYRLFDGALSAGSGVHASPNFMGHSTIGQVLDSAPVASSSYRLIGGYQASSQARPIEIPGFDTFGYINSIFASGIVAQTMESSSYQMLGTLGEVGLPNNQTTLSSSAYQHQPGFLAAAPSPPEPIEPPVNEPGPEPEPPPEPDCDFPTVSINDGEIFTGSPNVSLGLCAPYAADMIVSNDGGFDSADWETYANSKPWTITTHGDTVAARWVYVAYRDADGKIYSTYQDDIIFDPNAPTGELIVGDPWDQIEAQALAAQQIQAAGVDGATSIMQVGNKTYLRRTTSAGNQLLTVRSLNAGGIDLYLAASDDNSGIVEMQVGESPDLSDAEWEPYSFIKTWTPSAGDGERKIYARFKDSVGNESEIVENAFVIDSAAPTGELSMDPYVVSADTLTTTLKLQADDELSGITDMRVGLTEDLSEEDWQPYQSELVWPLYIDDEQQLATIYVQYRDSAGNVSAVYSDYYVVDRQAPVVYVEVEAADSLTRSIIVQAYDELSPLDKIYVSNDPLMVQDVTVITDAYTEDITWTFDDRRVVWVQVEDSNGNRSQPYPAYAASLPNDTPIPTPGPGTPTVESTPIPTLAPGEPTVEPTPIPTLAPGEPTVEPTPIPTLAPGEPTVESTPIPTLAPGEPTVEPTPIPTLAPGEPTVEPTATPTPYPDATLATTSDVLSGSAGSEFEIEGANFPPNQSLAIKINGVEVGTVKSDEDGTVKFVITTTDAQALDYQITIEGANASVNIKVDPDMPQRPADSDAPKVAIPADVKPMYNNLLPLIHN